MFPLLFSRQCRNVSLTYRGTTGHSSAWWASFRYRRQLPSFSCKVLAGPCRFCMIWAAVVGVLCNLFWRFQRLIFLAPPDDDDDELCLESVTVIIRMIRNGTRGDSDDLVRPTISFRVDDVEAPLFLRSFTSEVAWRAKFCRVGFWYASQMVRIE